MAKKRKTKSSKCPEPFNTLIDLAAAATLDYATYKRQQKRVNKNTKIDPYVATGAALGLGLIDDTEGLIKLGGALGTMGAFDDEDDYSIPQRLPNNSNKYAWRMNCQDGSQYDIYPEDYETRQEFNDAISLAKCNETILEKNDNTGDIASEDNRSSIKKHTYCRVSLVDNGKNDYYLQGELKLQVGDFVQVPTETGSSNAIVIQIQAYSQNEVPKPLDKTEKIIEKIFQLFPQD